MNKHWAKQQERGTAFFLTLTRLIVKYLPLPIIRVVNFWVVLYFYLTSRQKRCYIAEYQQKLTALFPETKLPKYAVFRQFLAFGEAITDRFAVWQKNSL